MNVNKRNLLSRGYRKMYFSIFLVIIGLISLIFVGALRGKEPMVSIGRTLITFVDGLAQRIVIFLAICVVFISLRQSKKNKELKRRIEDLESEVKEIKTKEK